MMELLGPMPRSMALSGTRYSKIFDKNGQLKRIRGLNYWPLHKVLEEKYKFRSHEAKAFANFLLPMLEWDPEKRASAKTMLDHEWIKAAPNYDKKYSAEEWSARQAKNQEEKVKLEFDAEELKVETSKLCNSDIEQNKGDDD